MADSAQIMKLRQATGAGMMDCKKALDESNGNFDSAIDLLRSSGTIKAAKKSDRAAHEGIVRFAVTKDGKRGSIARVHCETDFVARNEDFVSSVDSLLARSLEEPIQTVFDSIKDELVLKMGENIQLGDYAVLDGEYVVGYIHGINKIGTLLQFSEKIDESLARDIALHTIALSPRYISSADVPEEDLEREKAIYREKLRAEEKPKPENIMESIIKGKLAKFYQENCLLEQAFIKNEEVFIKDLLGNVSLVAFKLFSI